MNPKESEKLCLSLLKVTTGGEVVSIIKNTGLWNKEEAWREYGDDSMSWAVIGNQGSSNFSLNEKIVNGLDAVLMNKCWESGINPKDQSKNKPNSIGEAVNLYFKDKGIREIAANSLWVSMGGNKGKYPNICIADLGEGQTPEKMPNTILSLAKGNKDGIDFVQGNWNTGGSGALAHCGRETKGDDNEPLELTLILSKRNPKIIELFPEQKTENSEKWSFTVVRRVFNSSTGKSHAMCLAPLNCDVKPKEGELLRFTKNEMPILPEKKIQCSKNAKHGTLVKLFEYDTNKGIALLLGESLYTQLSVLLPRAFIPYMFHECRKDKSHNTYLEGFSKYIRRLNETRKFLEPEMPIKSFITVDQKTISFEVFIFKKDISVNQYKSNWGVAWTINGHTHALIKDRAFHGDFGELSKSMFVVLECEGIVGKSRENMFPTARDRLRNENPLVIKIKNELRKQLKDNTQIRDIEQRRNDEAAKDEPQIPESLKRDMQKILSENEMLELLQFGKQFTQKIEIKKKKTAIKGNLKYQPTFFYFQKKIPKSELKDQHGHIGSDYSYNLITDVVDDYFTRDKDTGYCKFLWTTSSNKQGDIVKLSGGPDTENGVCKFRISIPDDFKAGQKVNLKIVIGNKKDKEDFVLTVYFTILDKKKKSTIKKVLPKKPTIKKIKDVLRDDVKTGDDGKIDDKTVSSELIFPIWKKEGEWKEVTGHEPNDYEVLRVKKNRDPNDPSGKAFRYKAYLYESNIFLLKEGAKARSNYTWNMIKQRWWMYFVWLINGSVLQHRIDKGKNRLISIRTSDTDAKVKPDDIEVLEITARSVAMCVFLQQKHLSMHTAKNPRSSENLESYNESDSLK